MLPPRGSNLAMAQQELAQRRFKNVLKYAKRAQNDAPSSPVPQNLAGIALSAMARPTDAVKSFKRAIRLNPNYADARKNLAQTYLLMNQHQNVLLALRSVPLAPDVLYLKAQALAALSRKDEALDSAGQFIASAPNDKRGYKLRAFIRLQFGLIGDALEDYEKASTIDPLDAETFTLMSLPLARHIRSDDALQSVLRAVELDPQNIAAQLRLAAQYSEMGERELSIQRFRHVLTLAPYHSSALKSLSELLKGEELIALEQQVAQALAALKKSTEDEALLLFARSNILVAKGDRTSADKDIARANHFFAKRAPYMADRQRELGEQIMKRFPSTIVLEDSVQSTPRPIFVVGLPRSGTTLVEALLGRNEKVAPFGERGTIGFLLEETISNGLSFGETEIEKLRAEDHRLLPMFAEGVRAYVDKMPENYRIIGFLKSIYPDCKIINVQRDPRDIALSMFRAHFSGSALNYTYDLKAMAAHFNLYARMMAHWHQVLPEQIIDIQYEALVGDIESEGRKIADHCDLEWLPEMASPENTTSQVLTMSANQLRTPVHTKSVRCP